MQKLLFCFCLALVVTPVHQFALDGGSSEFACNLYDGNGDNSFIRQWSIRLSYKRTIEISGNSSDFILLPPHNSRLVIVRHDVDMFDGTYITCSGVLNLIAYAYLSVRSKYDGCITSYH